jgi:L-aspartate oxidase
VHKSDILVIGSGVAGLSFAIKMASKRPNLKITLLSKTEVEETNTKYAQGGIAAVWNFDVDSYQKHIDDTLDAGDGLCNPKVVNFVVKEGPQRVKELMEWGARFDKETGDHKFMLGREGGHSENRILHFKDLTGWEISRALLEKAKSFDNIQILENYFVVDILTQHHLGYTVTRVTPNIVCHGVYALNKTSGKMETFLSRVTVMASGGAGQVYKNTTNPLVASGDGIAMVYRAKGRVENMEFVQFHPTALFNPAGENPDFLISEAVRGFGAILKTADGREFMPDYDSRGSLAPRDIVARAIDNEMKKRGEDYVFLDARHLDQTAFQEQFPTIYHKCISLGIDPGKDMIPVVPACHYVCGGIKVDDIGRSSIQHLYACGECTSSGLHGANRLASNSLLEALVFAHRIHLDIVKVIDGIKAPKQIPEWDATGTTEPNEMVLITQSLKELKETMSSYVGIVRSNIRLKRAYDRLYLLYKETEDMYLTTKISPQLCELRNLLTIGYLITKSAMMRDESRGLHHTTDFPLKSQYLENTIL